MLKKLKDIDRLVSKGELSAQWLAEQGPLVQKNNDLDATQKCVGLLRKAKRRVQAHITAQGKLDYLVRIHDLKKRGLLRLEYESSVERLARRERDVVYLRAQYAHVKKGYKAAILRKNKTRKSLTKAARLVVLLESRLRYTAECNVPELKAKLSEAEKQAAHMQGQADSAAREVPALKVKSVTVKNSLQAAIIAMKQEAAHVNLVELAVHDMPPSLMEAAEELRSAQQRAHRAVSNAEMAVALSWWHK